MEEAEARQDALRTVALPGRSEHQTGLAVDFNDVSQNFQRTEAYQWLQRHGTEYGFVQRYQKEKESVTGVSEEPWHYRYVGRAHAGRMEKGEAVPGGICPFSGRFVKKTSRRLAKALCLAL